MSDILRQVLNLIRSRDIRVSAHGYDELASDGILARDALAGVFEGIVIEEHPDYYKGPCVLVLQHDADGRPIHVLWGIPRNAVSPAVLITAYRPDPGKWSEDYRRRR